MWRPYIRIFFLLIRITLPVCLCRLLSWELPVWLRHDHKMSDNARTVPFPLLCFHPSSQRQLPGMAAVVCSLSEEACEQKRLDLLVKRLLISDLGRAVCRINLCCVSVSNIFRMPLEINNN